MSRFKGVPFGVLEMGLGSLFLYSYTIVGVKRGAVDYR